MRLFATFLFLVLLAVGGVAGWLYIENDSRNVSSVAIPDADGGASGDGADGSLAAVDPALTEPGPYGRLPRIANGRVPWRTYRRPFIGVAERPKIAIAIVGLGLNSALTVRAIEQLPGPVTLVFSVYGDNLPDTVAAARRDGHEVLLQVGAEPSDEQHVDPGRWALMADLDAERNLDRLHWNLARAEGYVGILIRQDGPLMRSTTALAPVLLDLRERGLIFIDARPTSAGAAPDALDAVGTVSARATAWIDSDPTPSAIDAQLARAEAIAQASGVALVIGQAYPISIERVRRWTQDLERRGFSLAPLTAVAHGGAGQ